MSMRGDSQTVFSPSMGERESGSYSGTRQRNRIYGPSSEKLVGVTQRDPETPSGDPGRVFCSA